MTTYRFTAFISQINTDDDAAIEALFTDKFDIQPAMTDGQFRITAYVDADNEHDAAHRVLEHYALNDVIVDRIDPDLVNVTQIADEVGVDREAVRKWVDDPNFPSHHSIISVGTRAQKIWAWADVFEWIRTHRPRHIDGLDSPLTSDHVTIINGQLAVARRERQDSFLSYRFKPRSVNRQAPLFVESTPLELACASIFASTIPAEMRTS